MSSHAPSLPHPAAATVAAVRAAYGVTRETFRRLSGFSVRSQTNWERGTQEPGEPARLRLTELARLHRALARVIPPAALPTWLDTPNPAFDGLKPLEVIERGHTDRLWQMVFTLESGSPT